jgi:regulator of sigma E protease
VLWGIFWANGVNHVKAVVDKVVEGSPAAAAGLANGDEIRSIDGEPILDQVDASLGLLDAVSDDGEAVMNVRNRVGVERTVTLTISDPELRHRLTEPYQLYLRLGFEYWMPPFPAVLGGVEPGGPAAKAGLMAGDEIKVMDGTQVRSFAEFRDYVRARPGQEILVVARRGGTELTRRITSTRETEGGKVIGRLHITPPDISVPYPPEMRTHTAVGPLSALSYSVDKAWQMTAVQAKFLARMLTGNVSWKNTSGVIGIATSVGEAAHAGLSSFLMLLVLLSLSLGFLNLLPIPILDGGQIVFQLVEWAKGRPLSDRAYLVGQQAGLLLLVLLMGVALFNDLSNLNH